MAQQKKSAYVYRVEVDYAAAGVHKGGGTKTVEIYERRAGMLSKVRAAMDMGVHPRFITVRQAPADWSVDPLYEGLCPKCNESYDRENEACPQNVKIDKENARREEYRVKYPQQCAIQPNMQPLVRPHPHPYIISEIVQF